MPNSNNQNNETSKTSEGTNHLFYQFEHGERLKAEQEEKERQKAIFAKKMVKFGANGESQPISDSEVNQKAKMFVDIANMDPEKERMELERKIDFERKMKGFEQGSGTPVNNENQTESSEVSKKTILFTGGNDDQLKRGKEDEEKDIEKRKREFKEKSNLFDTSK